MCTCSSAKMFWIMRAVSEVVVVMVLDGMVVDCSSIVGLYGGLKSQIL